MPDTFQPELVLIAIAVIFLATVVQNYLKDDGKLTPARKAWLRIVFIFLGIGIVLFIIRRLLP